MDDPKQLRELARWYAAASANASDPRVKVQMAAQASALTERADHIARPSKPRVTVSLPA